MTKEDAIDVLKHNYPSACFTDLCDAVEIAIQALSAQPEIIRCKDCKHSWMNDELCLLMCHYRKCYHLVPEDGFCNFGEKSNEID